MNIKRERAKLRYRVYGLAGAMYAANAYGDHEMVEALKKQAGETAEILRKTYRRRESTQKEREMHKAYILERYDMLYGRE